MDRRYWVKNTFRMAEKNVTAVILNKDTVKNDAPVCFSCNNKAAPVWSSFIENRF